MSIDSLAVAEPVKSGLRPVGMTRTAGLIMVAAGAIGVAAVLVPGWDWTPAGPVRLVWRYSPAAGLLALGGLAAFRPRRTPAEATAVGGLLGLLIAGEGFVAVRDWFNVAGARGVALSNLADVVTIAAMTAVAGVVAALAGGVLAWPAGRSSGPPQRALLVIAATVAVGVPVIGAAVSGQMTVTTVGAVAVAWSLPWTSGLVAAAYAKPEVRRALVAAVAVCAVVAVLSVVLQPQ